MLLETSDNFNNFELLDTGNGFRLERWGQVVLQRSDPQIIWQRSLPDNDWQKTWAIYRAGSGEDKGRWEIKKPVPNPWVVSFDLSRNPHPDPLPSADAKALADKKGEGDGRVKFLLKLSPFKHTGIFAEQAAQWNWVTSKLQVHKVRQVKSVGGRLDKLEELDNFTTANKFRVLNLFAYTGGATMVLAKAGCQVTHVDASKPAISWANENYQLNFGQTNRPSTIARGEHFPQGNVRWILDDAVKFVKREIKRGAKYQGIIMDPPAFGHGPTGKTWKFNDDLPGLLKDCAELLSNDSKFLIINGYATNSSALSLNNLLQDSLKSRQGKIEFGELCLKQKSSRLISTGIFARWQS